MFKFKVQLEKKRRRRSQRWLAYLHNTGVTRLRKRLLKQSRMFNNRTIKPSLITSGVAYLQKNESLFNQRLMASKLQQYHNGLIEQKRIFRLVDRSLTKAKSDSNFRELTIVAAIVKSSETMGLQQDGSGTVLWLLLENKSRDDAQPAVQVMSELAHQRNNNRDALLRKQFLIDAEKFHVKHRLRSNIPLFLKKNIQQHELCEKV